jgi:hypothetical protein
MQLFQKCALLGLVAAVPAAAHALLLLPATSPCFTSGTATYQISAAAPAPDYRVRIDNAAAQPDLRVGLVDQPEIADFVLVDDLDAVQGNACAATTPPKTIRVDAGEMLPDLTVSLSQIGAAGDASDFKLYVRSARFSQEDAAALFGVMWRSRTRSLAQR